MDNIPVSITSGSSVPRRMRLPSEDHEDPDYRPPSRGSSSRPNSPLPTGVKPKKTNSTPLKYTVDDPSSCKISDNLADSCKTHCKICGEAFFLVKMRSHTLQYHGIQITKYKEMYGRFEIIEKVFHKCKLCGKLVLMDSDILGGHIKGTHKMKERDYKEKYCIYSDSSMKSELSVIKKSSVIKKAKAMKEEEKAFNPFTDIEYDCNIKHCDQCDKSSLVVQLAKLEKEHSEGNVNSEGLQVSGDCGEAINITEENLLGEEKDSHTSFLQDESQDKNTDKLDEVTIKKRQPLFTKSMPLVLQSCLQAEILLPDVSFDDLSSSDWDTSIDTSCSEWDTVGEVEMSEELQLSDGSEMIVEGVGEEVMVEGVGEEDKVMVEGVGEEMMELEECVKAIEEEQVSYCKVMDELDILLGSFEPAGGE